MIKKIVPARGRYAQSLSSVLSESNALRRFTEEEGLHRRLARIIRLFHRISVNKSPLVSSHLACDVFTIGLLARAHAAVLGHEDDYGSGDNVLHDADDRIDRLFRQDAAVVEQGDGLALGAHFLAAAS